MDDLIDDKVKVREKAPRERNRLIRLDGSPLGNRAHICAFFHNPEDEYRVLLPFIKDGFARGEKAFHTAITYVLDPAGRLIDHWPDSLDEDTLVMRLGKLLV